MLKSVQEFDVKKKTVLLRVDLNLPMSEGKMLNDSRIKAIMPTVKYLQNQGCTIILFSHFGRPKGKIEKNYSLEQILPALERVLGQKVFFLHDNISQASDTVSEFIKNHQQSTILLENIRFYEGEEKNDYQFAQNLAKLADFYVNDAFSCSHRAHASIDAITKFLPSAAGISLSNEVLSLENYLGNYEKPMLALVGGAKVSTKLNLLHSLLDRAKFVAIGGAMANTFLAAKGFAIGSSLHEPELLNEAKKLIEKANLSECELILPTDVVVAKNIADFSSNHVTSINQIGDGMILDYGPESTCYLMQKIAEAKTVVWNGPFGVFEKRPFETSSIMIARQIAKYTKENALISVVGGGDVVATIGLASIANGFTYISNAGGAFLEWFEGLKLPGLVALKKH